MPRVRLLRTRTAPAMTLPFTFMTMTQHEKNDEQDKSVENVAAQTAPFISRIAKGFYIIQARYTQALKIVQYATAHEHTACTKAE